MSRISELQAIIAQYDVNTHPFYTQWRAGTLPTERLADYAVEYGRFVATIADGWATLGHHELAEEERDHEAMWTDFRAELQAKGIAPRPQTDALVASARALFRERPEAIGALYAFEAQQPHTARTKLDGLVEHYPMSDKGRRYFEVHADDVREVEILNALAEGLSDEEFARAKTACSIVCTAMWGALDGVLYATPAAA